jgi:hypothetical protein
VTVLDRNGDAIVPGDVYVVAGPVRLEDGSDRVVMTLGDGRHSLRVRGDEVLPIDGLGGGGGGAPTTATYVTHDTEAGLTNSRRLASTTSVAVDLATGGQAQLKRAALTGDVTAGADSNATTIANDAVTTAKILDAAVTLAKLASIATDRLLGRDTAGSGVPEEVSLTNGLAFTGSGSIGITANAIVTAMIADGQVTAAKLDAGSVITALAAVFQSLDATLTALAGLATGADKLAYSTGTDTFAQTDFTAAGRALLDDADAAAQRVTLGVPNIAAKTSHEGRNSTTTLTDDSELQFAVVASGVYSVHGIIHFDAGSTPDFKWGLAGPTVSNIRMHRRWQAVGASAYAGIGTDTTAYPTNQAVTGTGTNGGFVEFLGTISIGAGGGGTVSFQWAQNTSDLGDVVVRAGSRIEWRKVA